MYQRAARLPAREIGHDLVEVLLQFDLLLIVDLLLQCLPSLLEARFAFIEGGSQGFGFLCETLQRVLCENVSAAGIARRKCS